jgi:hypothetical protein
MATLATYPIRRLIGLKIFKYSFKIKPQNNKKNVVSAKMQIPHYNFSSENKLQK